MAHIPVCKFTKVDPRAVTPQKGHASDAGYDLTLISIHKHIETSTSLQDSPKTTMYRTGIKISLEPGYYAEIVPRSSLVKTGYMLANSVGIIDNSYTGELFVVLTNVNSSPPLDLPFRGVQLIFRKQQDVELLECNKEEFDNINTERGSGGFGSTNDKK